MLRLISVAVLAALLALFPNTVRAGDADPETQVAKKHFEQGRALWRADDYERACRELQLARDVKPLPAFDLDVARCLERQGRPAEALAAYRRFVAATPGAKEAGEARARIAALEPPLAPPPPTATTPPPTV